MSYFHGIGFGLFDRGPPGTPVPGAEGMPGTYTPRGNVDGGESEPSTMKRSGAL